jgi:outer membrane protein assembly factor BamB
MSRFGIFLSSALIIHISAARAAESFTALMTAAYKGDVKAIEALFAKGAAVNEKTHYGATALWFAAYKGHVDAAKALLSHKADPNARDTVWGETPLSMAVGAGKVELVKALLGAGASGADAALVAAAAQKQAGVLAAILARGKIKADTLSAALFATPKDASEILAQLRKAGAVPITAADAPDVARQREAYVGEYESTGGMKFHVTSQQGVLVIRSGDGEPYLVREGAGPTFVPVACDAVTIRFERSGGKVSRLVIKQGTLESNYDRRDGARPAEPRVRATPEESRSVTTPQNWPSFRGLHASGVADGQAPPTTWDATKGVNVLWKTPVPGLGHSSPVVWGQRVFVTTAAADGADAEFKPGLYGAGTSAKDQTRHTWRLYCLDKADGHVLWQRTAREGTPKIKRHIKSSHANPTPATDGRHVVAYFGSEGLYCYDPDGQLLWQRDVGVIDVGAFNDPDLQWGVASSPILYRDKVILQCDRHKDSFLAAYDLQTGKEAWRTPREALPSWSTPTVYEGPPRDELVVNGTDLIRGYDPQTGKELWRLGRNSEIAVPAPVLGQGLIFVTSGYRPIQPIYAIRPGARGDISLDQGAEGNASIAWSKVRGGPYMPTPVVYGPYLYTCSNNGIVACYEARTGTQIYRERLGGSGGYSASPVAADGKLYFTSEESGIRVVRAGPHFELLAVNPMGGPCMATPAISDGRIFVRTQHALFALGKTPGGAQRKVP